MRRLRPRFASREELFDGGIHRPRLLLRLLDARQLRLLTHPIYAGAYVYGRRQTSEAIDATQRVIKRTQEIAREHRHMLIRDHHEGYIGWETYEQIQACIATNRRPTPRHVAFAVGSEIAVYPME